MPLAHINDLEGYLVSAFDKFNRALYTTQATNGLFVEKMPSMKVDVEVIFEENKFSLSTTVTGDSNTGTETAVTDAITVNGTQVNGARTTTSTDGVAVVTHVQGQAVTTSENPAETNTRTEGEKIITAVQGEGTDTTTHGTQSTTTTAGGGQSGRTDYYYT